MTPKHPTSSPAIGKDDVKPRAGRGALRGPWGASPALVVPGEFSRPNSSQRDRGDTLVEVLLAVIILGLAGVALIVAFQTSISASSEHRNLSNEATAMADITSTAYSQIRNNPSIFVSQQGLSVYQSLLTGMTLPTGFSVTVTGVTYWDPGTQQFTPANFTPYQPQLMTVRISTAIASAFVTHQVVLADPSPPAAPTYGTVPSQLAFAASPSGATLNSAFTTQPVVVVEDAAGNVVPAGLPYFTMSIVPSTNPQGANLSSTCQPQLNGGGSFQYQGCSIDQLGSGYELQVSAVLQGQQVTATSAAFNVTSVPLSAPAVTSVTPSSTTAGALEVNYDGSSNAPGGQNYVVSACTDPQMTVGCVSASNFASPGPGTLSGLVQGTGYYVQVEAAASLGYIAATSPALGPVDASVQLNAPTGVALDYGTTAGSLGVTFAGSSNASSAQTYSVTLCTNSAMNAGCLAPVAIASGGQVSGLNYSAGSPGAQYFATVVANSSVGYLASPASQVSSGHDDTSILETPTGLNLASSTTQAGAVTAGFSAPGNTAPTSYNATACTDSLMSVGCVTVTNYSAGSQLTGLVPGTSYYVAITAVGPSGYLNSNVESSGTVLATSQLTAPTGVGLGFGSVAGSIAVTFTGATPAVAGQTYTVEACRDAQMSLGCVNAPSLTSGGQITGLSFVTGVSGASYYVTVTANASPGYLASPASSSIGPQVATSQYAMPLLVAPSFGSVVGSLKLTFGASTGALPSSYSATLCTTSGMSSGCLAPVAIVSGGQVSGLSYSAGSSGTVYYATVSANANPTAGFAASAPSLTSGGHADTSVLEAPTGLTLASSTAQTGAVTVNFTAPGGTTPSSYNVEACTDVAMSAGCVTQTGYSSGAQVTGLVAGSEYYVVVTALGPTGYLNSSAPSNGAVLATSQLTQPSGVGLNYGTVAGSLVVNFSGSTPAPAGQTYSVTLCTNSAMNSGCTAPATIPGGQVSGLSFVAGSPGTTYYATVSANASPGFLASAPSLTSGGHADTSVLEAPSGLTLTPSSTQTGTVSASFTAPGGTPPSSYNVEACTDSLMSANCVPQANYSSGAPLTGLSAGSAYYVMVTALGPTGYLNSTVQSSGTVLATSQLTQPSGVTLNYGTVAGSLVVTFNGSSNAPAGQIYSVTLCTVSTMNSGCTAPAAIVSGGQVTGLNFVAGSPGTTYYATVSANASPSYLASSPSTTSAGHLDTSVYVTPTGVGLNYGTVAGSLVVNFSGSTGTAPASYSVTLCTNSAMNSGCTAPATIVPGGQVSGLSFVAGSPGTTYYATVSANANPTAGFAASAPSLTSGGHADTSVLGNASITSVTAVSSTSLRVTFSGPNGVAPSSFSVQACINSAMNSGCTAPAAIVSGGTITNLTNGSYYYVTITAVTPSSGYVSSVTPPSSPVRA